MPQRKALKYARNGHMQIPNIPQPNAKTGVLDADITAIVTEEITPTTATIFDLPPIHIQANNGSSVAPKVPASRACANGPCVWQRPVTHFGD